MARDPERPNPRRRRRPGAGGPAAGSARASARDAGMEPTDAELDATPAPEPTKHGMPWVDDARMAEAGVPMGDADFDRGDEARGQDAAAPADPAVVQERAAGRPGRPRRGKVLTFLGHVVDELRRVQWPDRRQTGQGTAVTLGFVVIAGGFLGLMDAIWQPLIEALL